MAEPEFERRIADIRAFNRFYTEKIGVLRAGLLDSPFSLTEVRVLYELAHRDAPTPGELARALGLDAGYLSRILRRFQRENLISRRRSQADARRVHLALTERGRETFAELDRRSRDEVAAMIGRLDEDAQGELVTATQRIRTLLDAPPEERTAYLLRPHRAGDMAWVVWRHAAYYQGECGWSDAFMAVVMRAVAQFIDTFDPARERCWIAEHGGRRAGCVFLVRERDDVARLRLLLVEPAARGLGIGRRLVEECVGTARELGYRKMVLWTSGTLHAARRIYEDLGFRKVDERPCPQLGADFVGQDWELDLE